MIDDILNTELVRQAASRNGYTLKWLINELDMSTTSGYLMLREGLLPANGVRRKHILGRLGTLLGINPKMLILSPYKSKR